MGRNGKAPKRPMAGFSRIAFGSDDEDGGRAGTAVPCKLCGKQACFCRQDLGRGAPSPRAHAPSLTAATTATATPCPNASLTHRRPSLASGAASASAPHSGSAVGAQHAKRTHEQLDSGTVATVTVTKKRRDDGNSKKTARGNTEDKKSKKKKKGTKPKKSRKCRKSE